MKFIKRALIVFGDFLIADIIAFAGAASFFPKAIDVGTPRIIFSIVMSLVFIFFLYPSMWRYCDKDYRSYKIVLRHNPETGKFKIYMGFMYAIPFGITLITFAVIANIKGGTVSALFKIINIIFAGFVLDGANNISIFGTVMTVVGIFVISELGYAVGKTGYSISENVLPKIVYKQKKK